MLRYVNDNKLGEHVVMLHVPTAPLKIDYPKHKEPHFNPRPKTYLPTSEEQPLGYNPGEKPKQSNQYINNYPNVHYRQTTHGSAIDDWFGDFSKS